MFYASFSFKLPYIYDDSEIYKLLILNFLIQDLLVSTYTIIHLNTKKIHERKLKKRNNNTVNIKVRFSQQNLLFSCINQIVYF